MDGFGGRGRRGWWCVVRTGVLASMLGGMVSGVRGAPTIVHDSIRAAVQGEPLGVRTTVRDASGRVTGVSLFYASSRGMTPFRTDMTTTGAGIWFGTIPGHLIGPGSNLFYYVHAENLEGESTDTDWFAVEVVEPGLSASDIPSARTVALQSQRAASPGGAAAANHGGRDDAEVSSSRGKYWVPVAVIAGGAVAIGGGLALANSGGGGGGGGGSDSGGTVTNGNYGGSYSVCFEPTGTNAVMTCDSGLVNLYVENGRIQVVGLWGSEVLETTLNGRSFTAVGTLAARGSFPAAHLIVSGDVGQDSCTARVDGYSTASEQPGSFSGQLSTTRR